jgi:hypothetical protein
MQFTRENRADISKYYSHTFVKFKEHAIEKQLNADTLFYIEHVDDSKVIGKCENGDPFIIWLSDKYPFESDYVLPHKSFFQLGEHAVLLERIPAQQYFRGLCPENTQMTYLHGAQSPKKTPIGFDSLKAFVTKQSFFSLQSAIAAEQCTTCVLSPRIQYGRHTNFIYVDHIPVAKVLEKKKEIVMIKHIFREEIEELLKANDETDQFTFHVDKQKQW